MSVARTSFAAAAPCVRAAVVLVEALQSVVNEVTDWECVQDEWGRYEWVPVYSVCEGVADSLTDALHRAIDAETAAWHRAHDERRVNNAPGRTRTAREWAEWYAGE